VNSTDHETLNRFESPLTQIPNTIGDNVVTFSRSWHLKSDHARTFWLASNYDWSCCVFVHALQVTVQQQSSPKFTHTYRHQFRKKLVNFGIHPPLDREPGLF